MQFRQAITFVGWSPISVTIHRGQGGRAGFGYSGFQVTGMIGWGPIFPIISVNLLLPFSIHDFVYLSLSPAEKIKK